MHGRLSQPGTPEDEKRGQCTILKRAFFDEKRALLFSYQKGTFLHCYTALALSLKRQAVHCTACTGRSGVPGRNPLTSSTGGLIFS